MAPTQKEETVRVFEVVDLQVFNRPHPIESPGTTSKPLPSAQISSNQEPTDILESHVGGSTPMVAVQPRLLTPLPTHTFPSEQLEKMRKREKKYPKRAKLLPLKTSSLRKEQKCDEGFRYKKGL